MSAVESALDVLSRAATMVQEEEPKVVEICRKASNGKRKKRRMDPIQNEALDMSTSKTATTTHHRPSVIIFSASQPDSGGTSEWDSTTRPPGTSRVGDEEEGNRAYSIYDCAIDEHFKRSLGAETYAAVYNGAAAASATDSNSSSAGGDREVGLTVDDHFAKSLGEKWTTLKDSVEDVCLIIKHVEQCTYTRQEEHVS